MHFHIRTSCLKLANRLVINFCLQSGQTESKSEYAYNFKINCFTCDIRARPLFKKTNEIVARQNSETKDHR